MFKSPQRESYFRSDIQGLRGIAVLLVVIYHTGFALPGGFIGVDMFFVISGFVITQVLLREYEESGKISLSHFYARRARRLIPALSAVTIFTLLISLVAMSPFGEQQQIIKTAIASTFFAGNIHLFAMNSYEALRDNPLRHLWSLGVEEQFYWIYPVLFIGISRVARKRFYSLLTILLLAFAATSFVIGVLLTYGFEFGYTSGSSLSSQFSFLTKIGFEPGGDWPTKFAFFGAPARFWEILLGSITALAVRKFTYKFRVTALLLVVVAVAALIWSSVALNSRSAFPGALALLPVLGTVSLIFFNQQVGPINKLLTSSPLVYLGDISYSLYLWHWPLIVFSRAIWPGTSDAPLIAAAISFLPAVLSARYVESVFLNSLKSKHVGNIRRTGLVVLAILPLLISGAGFQVADSGLGIDGIEFESDHFASLLGNDCSQFQKEFETKCLYGDDSSKFVAFLFGDSQAQAASTGVVDAIAELSGQLVIATGGGCPFLLVEINGQCDSFNEVRFSKIRELNPDFVIIVNHQTAYRFERMSGTRVSSWSTATKQIEALSKTLEWLDNLKIPAVVQGEIPVCDFKLNLISRVLNWRQSCLRNFDRQTQHLEFLSSTQKVVSKFDRHVFFDPTSVICPNSKCAPFSSKKMVFVDISHLSPSGSSLVTPLYIEAIKQVLEQK